MQILGKEKCKTLLQILKWKFLAKKSAKFIANFSVLARKGAKFIANFSATNVTSLPSHSLSLSLCFMGSAESASYIVREVHSEREREREREIQRETEVTSPLSR